MGQDNMGQWQRKEKSILLIKILNKTIHILKCFYRFSFLLFCFVQRLKAFSVRYEIAKLSKLQGRTDSAT